MIPSQWRIQDFPQRGAPTSKIAIIFQIFAENCMKMKEFGPPGGARVPGCVTQFDTPEMSPKACWNFFQKIRHLQTNVCT